MRYVTIFILATIGIQCSRDTERTLYKNKGPGDPVKYVKYSGSERREYFLEAEMINNDENCYYNIRFLKSGKVMHALKYESRYIGKDGYDNQKQFLVTDTLSEYGPNYFGEGINGYYDHNVVNNFLSQPHPPKTISKVSVNESLLFKLIDSVTKVKRVNLNKVDSIGIVGWVKYDF